MEEQGRVRAEQQQRRLALLADFAADLGEEDVVPAEQEVVPPIQEEAAGTSQEERQDVGVRGRVRGRGRGGRGGGRDRAGGVRQKVRAPNCLPVCPAGCRGLGPACLAVATTSRGTPARGTPTRGRVRGRGRRGRARGGPVRGSQAGASQSQPGSTQPPSPNSQDTVPVPANLPIMEEAHSTHIPTHKFPPKSVRAKFSRVLGALWYRMADNPEDVSLRVLESIFPRVILLAVVGPRQGDAYSQARAVRVRLRRWRLGEYGELWDKALEAFRLPPRARRGRAGGAGEKTLQEKNGERAARIAQEGQYRPSPQPAWPSRPGRRRRS